MVLFIGDCPSPKMRKGARAFDGAACEARLMAWIKQLEPKTHFLLNSATEREQKIIATLCKNNSFKVVALGQAASARLAALNIVHYTLPHPSGRNRLLNNANYVKVKLSEAKTFISESP